MTYNSWEPVDIDPTDRDEIEEEYGKWDDNLMNELERKIEELRWFNATLETSSDKDMEKNVTLDKLRLKKDRTELVANQICDKMTKLFNDTRLGIKGGARIEEPIRNYDNFDPDDNGKLTFTNKKAINFGNINEGLIPPSRIRESDVNRLKLMGFTNKTNEDLHPYRSRYKDAREKVRKLGDNLNERSKAIQSSSTMDAKAIELMEITSEDIDTAVKDVGQETYFIELGERDKLLPLRELERLDKQLRIIRGSLKVATAKRIELEGCIKHEENKLNEIQDPTYSDDQRKMIEDRIKNLRDELNEKKEEVNISEGEASKQINQI